MPNDRKEALTFDVELTERDMVRFNLFHTYSGFQGWFSCIVAVAAFFVAWWSFGKVSGTMTVLYCLIGALILAYIPANIVLSAKHRIRRVPELLAPLHYRVDGQGIGVEKDGDNALLAWDQIFRVRTTKEALYVYSSRVHAYVIPRRCLTDGGEAFLSLAKEKLGGRVR